MARFKIRYLVEHRGAKGGVRYFWQPAAALRAEGWRLTRLPDDRNRAIAEAETLNATLDAWRRGLVARPAAPGDSAAPEGRLKADAGTVNQLIEAYRKSADFAALSAKTRGGYDYTLNVVKRWAGPEAWAVVTARDVATLYRELSAETPAKAAAVVRTVSLLYGWGRRNLKGFPEANPAAGQKVKTPKRGGALWSPDAVTAFVAAADEAGLPSLGTAVMLNEWLGQREGDVIRLPRSAYQASTGTVIIRQSKRGAVVELPIGLVPKLKARLETELARRVADDENDRSVSTLLVNERTGRPWDELSFRKTFAKVRMTAGTAVEGLTFMRLRHTAVTRLAEAGCTQGQIASITGHTEGSIRSVIEIYRVRTKAMAIDAFTLRLAKEEEGRR